MAEVWHFDIRLPLVGATLEQLANGVGYFTVCRAISPEGCAEVVRVLALYPSIERDHIRIEMRKQS